MEKQLNSIRKHLEGVRDLLLEELALKTGQRNSARQGDSMSNKEEAARAFFEMDKRTARINTLKESLAEVENALDKLERGTYGLCNGCNKPISPARLEAIPQAALCIDCKSASSKA